MTRPTVLLARTLFVRMLAALPAGPLELVEQSRAERFGDGRGEGAAVLVVHNDRFFSRAVFGGDIGMGESYMDGDWDSPDLVGLLRLLCRNLPLVERRHRLVSLASRAMNGLARRLRGNSPSGSRRNVRRHYDLGNDFFRLCLDDDLHYSCAVFERPDDSLETAQWRKIDRVCRKLRLGPDDHVLEIGSGWGGFAAYAAARYGCRVTATTISGEQYRYAVDRMTRLGGEASRRIRLLLEDYRRLRGRFDKIVSIEMFEAVGLAYYDDFFGACDRLLEPHGSMLLQTITVDEQRFHASRGRADWIEKHIFPGSELASIGEILASLGRSTTLSLFHAENIGTHYARTLHAWRDRFWENVEAVRRLGFDERFVRMWDLYLAYCEAAFLERHIGDFQLVLSKNGNRRALMGEPWGERADDGRAGRSDAAEAIAHPEAGEPARHRG